MCSFRGQSVVNEAISISFIFMMYILYMCAYGLCKHPIALLSALRLECLDCLWHQFIPNRSINKPLTTTTIMCHCDIERGSRVCSTFSTFVLEARHKERFYEMIRVTAEDGGFVDVSWDPKVTNNCHRCWYDSTSVRTGHAPPIIPVEKLLALAGTCL